MSIAPDPLLCRASRLRTQALTRTKPRTSIRMPALARRAAALLWLAGWFPPLLHAQGSDTFAKIVAMGGNGGVVCVLTAAGGVKCSGYNGYGQLGVGTTGGDSPVLIDVPGLTRGIRAIGIGKTHACAMLETGAVKCWGGNDSGQLGIGSTTSALSPTDVPGVGGGGTIALGFAHTCANIVSGEVKCWGRNDAGQIGDGTTANQLSPVQVPGLVGVSVLAAGYAHTCARTSGGPVKCWGSNSNDQLGVPFVTLQSSSTPVDPNIVADQIWAGDSHNCVLTSAGVVKCWGANANDQLGATQPSNSDQLITVALSGGAAATDGAASVGTSCAVVGGATMCWGIQSISGCCTYTTTPTPFVLPGMESGVVSIAASGYRVCAAMADGSVQCWSAYTGATTPLPFGVPLPPPTPASTTTTLSLSPNSATVNQAVTASVQVSGIVLNAVSTPIAGSTNPRIADSASSAAISVSVSGGGQSCTAALSAGSVGSYSGSCTLSFPVPGTYAITASYPGNSANAPSSASQNLIVNAVVVPPPSVAAPALGQWAVVLLAVLLVAFAWRRRATNGCLRASNSNL